MKAWKTALSLLAGMLLGLPQVVAPCDIDFAPREVSLAKGKEIVITLIVFQEHRSCSVDIDETVLQAEGVIITKKGKWTQVSNREYRIDLTVKLTGASGMVRVVRECDKRGTSSGELKLTAK